MKKIEPINLDLFTSDLMMFLKQDLVTQSLFATMCLNHVFKYVEFKPYLGSYIVFCEEYALSEDVEEFIKKNENENEDDKMDYNLSIKFLINQARIELAGTFIDL